MFRNSLVSKMLENETISEMYGSLYAPENLKKPLVF